MDRMLPRGGWVRIFLVIAAASAFGGPTPAVAWAGSAAAAASPAPAKDDAMLAVFGDMPDRQVTGLSPQPKPGAENGLARLDEPPAGEDIGGGDSVQEALPPAASDAAPAPQIPAFAINVPAVNAVDSNVDEATLKDILSGKIGDHADAIAKLNATRITIPEIDVAMTIAARTTTDLAMTLRDIVFDKVVDGIAQSVEIGSMDSRSEAGGDADARSNSHFGKTSAEEVNLGLFLQIYGLIKGDPSAPLSPAYRNMTMAGGTSSGPDEHCTFGRIAVARVEARPLKVGLGAFVQLMDGAERNSRQAVARLADAYGDLFSSFRTTPMEFGGFTCNRAGGEPPLKLSVGGITMGAFGGARYPDLIVRDIDVDAGDAGTFSLSEFHLKSFDLSSTFEAARAIGAGDGETPTAQELRALIPPFVGFAMSDLAIDVPDEEKSGQRIKARLANFDLDLGNYVNGIPTQFSSHASHLAGKLPAASSDSSVQSLIAVGIRNFDVSYDLAAYWDEPSKEIRLTRLSVDGANLGQITASAVIGQVDRTLFSTGSDALAAGLLVPTLKRANVNVTDDGLGDLLAKAAATGSGKGVAQVRRSSAALLQATMLIFLGGAANGQDVSAAVGKFVNGARGLSVSALANDPAGVAFHVLQSLAKNPGEIGNQVTIDAVAH